jgi:hypothetical protein
MSNGINSIQENKVKAASNKKIITKIMDIKNEMIMTKLCG